MLSFDEMPKDNADLATVEIDFPRLKNDSPDGCPVSVSEILEYLALEVPDGDQLTADDLEFVRTAKVAERDYWIWRFNEPDGDDAYATVYLSRKWFETCTGYDTNYYKLTPEQYILGDYHDCF